MFPKSHSREKGMVLAICLIIMLIIRVFGVATDDGCRVAITEVVRGRYLGCMGGCYELWV